MEASVCVSRYVLLSKEVWKELGFPTIAPFIQLLGGHDQWGIGKRLRTDESVRGQRRGEREAFTHSCGVNLPSWLHSS